MAIKIKKNDYVQPTEIREEVVQLMCDYIIMCVEKKPQCGWGINLSKPRQVWLGTNDEVTKVICIEDSFNKNCDYPQIRVNGVELKKVFELLFMNGWHLHCSEDFLYVLKEPIYKDVPYYDINFFID